MNWRNVWLILAREIRDQLRDRRTLFMIAVVPLLLYPLLGMSFFQLAQFMREQKTKVLVVGAEQLEATEGLPPLITDSQFAPSLFSDPSQAEKVVIVRPDLSPSEDGAADSSSALEAAKAQLSRSRVQLVLYFPANFGERLAHIRRRVLQSRGGQPTGADDATANSSTEPELCYLFHNAADEKSQVAQIRVERLLQNWQSQVTQRNLIDSRVPVSVVQPFQVRLQDVAEDRQRQAAIWSKILPFVLVIWTLTGAFYPAVDLCAGEKERGTLETLLASPALRQEIVWGKLLTVMAFSMVTAALNLATMGLTGIFIISQLNHMPNVAASPVLAVPPWSSVLWLAVALVPLSALFSALCLACAAFARSTKEGQYYLIPILLVTLPLMMLPMAPGVELNVGNSLIPVTGVVLLLRAMIEGDYVRALPFIIPVAGVTLMCCLLAIRWAVDQFNRESVLFRESERLDLRRWLVHLVRDRQDVPTVAEAFACGIAILVIQFFVNVAVTSRVPESLSFNYAAKLLFISQIVCILFPAVLFTLLFTRKPRVTLLLSSRPAWTTCGAAVLLAVLLHPVGIELSLVIKQLYPLSPEIEAQTMAFAQLLEAAPYAWMPFVLMAVIPAICEEFAFRGFILSGLRHLGHKWWAICISAIFFGFAHMLLQQKLSATLLGCVLGFLAVQSGSLIACILFHMTYNGLLLLVGHIRALLDSLRVHVPMADQVLPAPSEEIGSYGLPIVSTAALLALVVLFWFHRLPYQRSDEEKLQEALDHQSAHPLAGEASGS